MTSSKKYTLSELIEQCDSDAPVPQSIRDWETAPMVGLEQLALDQQVDIRKAVLLFADKITPAFDVRQLILFGSRARGDHHSESDTDVAVILRGAPGDFVETKLALASVAFDVLLETGALIQPLPIWQVEWNHPERYSNPELLRNIVKDGVLIWVQHSPRPE